MRGPLFFLACLALTFTQSPTYAEQALAVQKAASTIESPAAASAPVAFIYVSSNYSGSNNQVVGYTANAEGQLAKIPGSPWADNIISMAANGTFLFGSDNVPNDNGRNIYSYRIESNGALKYLGAIDIQKTPGHSCDSGSNLLLDHTGAYLYQFVYNPECLYPEFTSFVVNRNSGLLSYLGSTDRILDMGPPLTLAGKPSRRSTAL